MRAEKCPFCDIRGDRIIAEGPQAIAIPDGFPVSEGHTLVIPKRHVSSIFDLETNEYDELWAFMRQVHGELLRRFRPTGVNIGVNDGEAAGQTVEHAHIHLIPRYAGDVPYPRGGIRWIIPEKAKYWK